MGPITPLNANHNAPMMGYNVVTCLIVRIVSARYSELAHQTNDAISNRTTTT
jgi:hypothetical protein